MQKIFFIFVLFIFTELSVFSSDIPNAPYKNIKNNTIIYYNNNTKHWSIGKSKLDNYYTKTKGFGEYSDYLDKNDSFAFTTDCEYEFIQDGMLIGFSNKFLKFYNFQLTDGIIEKQELSYNEVKKLFPNYTIIKLSDFSPNTNSIKIKKGFGNLNIILFNDIGRDFNGYELSTGNSKIETCKILGMFSVLRPGMIQFAKPHENSPLNPWFIILIR